MEQSLSYPLAAQFQNNIDVVMVVEESVKADNVLVIQALMNGDLLSHFVPLIALRYYRLWNDLAGVNLV